MHFKINLVDKITILKSVYHFFKDQLSEFVVSSKITNIYISKYQLIIYVYLNLTNRECGV